MCGVTFLWCSGEHINASSLNKAARQLSKSATSTCEMRYTTAEEVELLTVGILMGLGGLCTSLNKHKRHTVAVTVATGA